jgi:hypothetical protein
VASIKLTNLASYKAYFAAIAASHVDIDGFKWGDKDVIRNDNRSDITESFLWAMPYDRARYGDKVSDNVHKYKVARVAFMIVPASELFSDEEAAFDFCEATIEQILAKILKDKRGADNAGVWDMLITDINSWTTGPVEKKIGSTKYIGWEFQLTFQDPTNLSYNQAKWT